MDTANTPSTYHKTSPVSSRGNLWKVCGLTAETLGARIIVPTHAKIIHPPDLGLAGNSDVDADESQIGEVVVKVDEGEIAVAESRASRDGL